MTSKLCIHLTVGSCLCGFLLVLPEIAWIGTLPFCGSNQIQQIFCDSPPLCWVWPAQIHPWWSLWMPSMQWRSWPPSWSSPLSYLRIIVVILQMPSAEGRHKAFSTCAPPCCVLAVFCHVAVMYLRISATYSVFWDTAIADTFVILAPFLNPIIYSLRNKDMKDAIGRLFGYQKRAGGIER